MSDSLASKVSSMSTDISNIKEEISEIKQMLREHIQDEKLVWGKFSENKANVWVEKAISYTMYTVAGVIIIAILSLILIHVSNVDTTL